MSAKTQEHLEHLVQRWYTELWQRGNAGAVNELHAAHFVDHSPPYGRPPDRRGFREAVAELYRAFPDFFATVEDLIFDLPRSLAVIRWTAYGTHQGEFMGISATQRRITFCGIEILRVEDDHIAERWGEWDGLDLMRQLQCE